MTRHLILLCALGSLLLHSAQTLEASPRKGTRAQRHKAKVPPRSSHAQAKASSTRTLRRTFWRTLIYRLRRPDPRNQRRIAWELRRRNELRALPYLLGMLRKRKQPYQRQGALRALAQFRHPWTLPLLWAHRKDPHPGVRLAALEALGDFCDQRRCQSLQLKGSTEHAQHQIVQHLLAQLKTGKAATIRVALTALSTIDDPAVLPQLQAIYQAATPPHGTGLWYSRTLATLGDPAKRTRWAQLATQRATWTGERLAHWPGRWATTLLAAGLRRPDPRQRRWATRWLQRKEHPLRTQALQKACAEKAPTDALSSAQCRRLRQSNATPSPLPTDQPPLFLLSQQQATQALATLSQQTPRFDQRLERISRRMLGTPYILDPLGEGKDGRYDRDPIFTLKRVDCVTFVEQVIAMTHVPSLPKAIQFAQQIRYEKGRIDYRFRRHLPIAQWIPAMIKMGIGRDITRQVGGDKTSLLHKTIDAKSYSTREGRTLQSRLGKQHIVMGQFQLPYLTPDVALARLKSIPSGTVLSSLRNHNPYSPGQVTHQGLIIRHKGALYMRHASSRWRSIIDVPLRSYLYMLKVSKRPRIGIHLLQLVPK